LVTLFFRQWESRAEGVLMRFLDFERVLELLEELREEALSSPVLVEGRRDELALRRLGVEGEFIWVSNHKPWYEMCEEISRSHRRVIMLLDADRAGRAMSRRIKHHLSQMGVQVVERHTVLLKLLDTHQVEHLAKRFERVRAMVYPRGAGDADLEEV